MPFETLDHTADVGLRALGASLGEAFEQAALGLTALMIDPRTIVPRERVTVCLSAPGIEALLVQWLSGFLAEMDLSGRVFGRFAVEVEAGEAARLRADMWGEPIDRSRHEVRTEVKGVSYLGLLVEPSADGWVIECVLDV